MQRERATSMMNILPAERLAALRRAYLYRLASVALLFATLLVAANAVFLIPTHDYLARELAARAARLTSLDQSLGSADERELASRLATLEAERAELLALATSSQQSAILAMLVALPHPDIALTGFALTPPQGRAPESVALSGTAATRDALRAYYLELSGTPGIAAATLPVSAYAAAANAPFTIMLTLP